MRCGLVPWITAWLLSELSWGIIFRLLLSLRERAGRTSEWQGLPFVIFECHVLFLNRHVSRLRAAPLTIFGGYVLVLLVILHPAGLIKRLVPLPTLVLPLGSPHELVLDGLLELVMRI